MRIIKIDLKPKDAELFKTFRKYQDDISLLINTGVFDLEEGQIILNKKNNQIQNIRFHLTPYKRKKS